MSGWRNSQFLLSQDECPHGGRAVGSWLLFLSCSMSGYRSRDCYLPKGIILERPKANVVITCQAPPGPPHWACSLEKNGREWGGGRKLTVGGRRGGGTRSRLLHREGEPYELQVGPTDNEDIYFPSSKILALWIVISRFIRQYTVRLYK